MGRSEFLDSAHIGDVVVVWYERMVRGGSDICAWYDESQIGGGHTHPRPPHRGYPVGINAWYFFKIQVFFK